MWLRFTAVNIGKWWNQGWESQFTWWFISTPKPFFRLKARDSPNDLLIQAIWGMPSENWELSPPTQGETNGLRFDRKQDLFASLTSWPQRSVVKHIAAKMAKSIPCGKQVVHLSDPRNMMRYHKLEDCAGFDFLTHPLSTELHVCWCSQTQPLVVVCRLKTYDKSSILSLQMVTACYSTNFWLSFIQPLGVNNFEPYPESEILFMC